MVDSSPSTAVLESSVQVWFTNDGFKNYAVEGDTSGNNPDGEVEEHSSNMHKILSQRRTGGESNCPGVQRRLSLGSWSPVLSFTESRQPAMEENAVVRTDRCIDWLVVLASFFIHFIVDGIINSFGVLYVALLNEFEESRSATSWVGAVQIALSWVMGPIASSLSEKFGHRAVGITGSIVAATGFGVSSLAPNLSLLYLTYGVLTGLGFGMMFFQSIVSVQDHFEKRKSLAMGVAVCGSGVGTFSMVTFTEFIVQVFSWRYALLVLAGCSLSGIVFSILIPTSELKSNEGNGSENTSNCCDRPTKFFKNVIHVSLLRRADFVVWLVCMLMIQIGLVVLHIYIPDIARDVGIGVNKAAFLLSIVGVANTVARIVMGAFADFRCANRRYMLGASIMVRGVIVSMLPSLTGYDVIATVCGFYGLTVGTTISLVPVVLRDLVGIEKLGPSFGLTMVAVGLGSLLLSTGGSLYDLTGSYDLTLYITGSLLFIAGGTIMSLPWVRKMQNRCCYHGSASITTETEP